MTAAPPPSPPTAPSRYDYIKRWHGHLRKILRDHPRRGRSLPLLRGGGGRRRADDPCLRPRWRRPAFRFLARRFVAAARAALQAGAPILCDAEMVARGVTRRAPAGRITRCSAPCAIRARPALAGDGQHALGRGHPTSGSIVMAGAVVAIGNAPTALFRLLELLRCRRAAAGRHPRHAGRLRRRGGIQGGAHRAKFLRRALDRRARPARRQRHDGCGASTRWRGRGYEQGGDGDGTTLRRRHGAGRSGAADAEGGARRSRAPMCRLFRQGRQCGQWPGARSRDWLCARTSPSCRCSIP
jgi:hypothetical protein